MIEVPSLSSPPHNSANRLANTISMKENNPAETTIATYQQYFDRYVERTQPEVSGEFREWMDSFLSYLPQQGEIFELGSAVGRDARYFREKGYQVMCTDIIPQALEKLSEDGFETAKFDFRDVPKQEWLGKFDGFFANAVLLHAEPDVFENALRNAATLLKENGTAAISLKTGEGEEISLEKMDAPRYFRYHSETEIREVLSKLPFDIISINHADNQKWLHIIMRSQPINDVGSK